jgi:hypothetical protein
MSNPSLSSPPIPGTTSGDSQYGNPWFAVANQFLPRNFIDTIRWSKYIILQSPVIAETLRKYATYPITDFTIDTKNAKIKDKYLEILKSFKMKEALMNIGFEYFTIGNSFISIYFPIHRSLGCPLCKTTYAAKKAKFVQFKQWQYHGSCPSPDCGYKGIFARIDSKSKSIEDMNVIRWDPLSIVVNNNPITGEKEYFYKIPNSLKNRIIKGDRLLVDSIPWGFIEAARQNQDFKFDKDSLYHLMNVTTGASVEGTAIPPMLSLYSLVFYQATLRKANEAISMEYLNPLRVVFPQAQTANSDPVIAMSMRNFVGNMQAAFLSHKKDPNHLVFAPSPVGYQALGGEGKNLLVSQEIQQAEDSILLALGVSRELLSGTTNWNSTSIGLRMMQALLFNYTSRLGDFIDWSMNKVSAYLEIENVKIDLLPFKLVDDDNIKQLLATLAQAGKASFTTLFEESGLDFAREQDRIKEEAIEAAKTQVELQYDIEQAQFLAGRKKTEDMNDNEDYKTALQKAQDMAAELSTIEDGTKRKFLNNLKVTDYGQYLMVSKLLEEYAQSAQHQAELEQNTGSTAASQVEQGNTIATPTAASSTTQ